MKTKDIILKSFSNLAINLKYDEFGIEQIIKNAKVARSTFYYHFNQKDDLLFANLEPFFEAIILCVLNNEISLQLENWLNHLWENRQNAKRLLSGQMGTKISQKLDNKFQESFNKENIINKNVEPKLLSAQLSGAIINLLQSWLCGYGSANSKQIANMILNCNKML